MPESTKIDFQHRRVSQISDFTELIAMLVPGNHNQQHAAACMFLELKWANCIVPNLAYIETKYGISRRILQRARAKLSRLGLIEHVSYLNSRYGGQHGWKLSSRFETGLRQLAERCATFGDRAAGSQDKDKMMLALVAVRQPSRVLQEDGDVTRLTTHAQGCATPTSDCPLPPSPKTGESP